MNEIKTNFQTVFLEALTNTNNHIAPSIITAKKKICNLDKDTNLKTYPEICTSLGAITQGSNLPFPIILSEKI
jgi:hypothetical protein